MSTDPSYSHLGELLTLIREEMRRGFADIKAELSDRVSVDVYEADKRLADERNSRLGAEVAELRADIDRAEERVDDERTRADERRAADRRMIVSALLGAGLALVVAIASAALL